MIKTIVSFLTILFCTQIQGQCPSSEIVLETTELCTNQSLGFGYTSEIFNNTYTWDLCSGDLEDTPTAHEIGTIDGFNLSYDLNIHQSNGNWYAFVPSRSKDDVIRVSLASSLDYVMSSQRLNIPDGILENPNGIHMYQYAGHWYGLIVNFNNDRVTRLSFGADLSSEPLIESVNVSVGVRSSGIIAKVVNDEVVVFITTNTSNELYRFIMPLNSLNATNLESIALNGYTSLSDIDLIKECDQWVGVVTSFSDEKVSKLEFASSIFGTPGQTDLSKDGSPFKDPTRAEIVSENGNYYIFLQERAGNLISLNYQNSFSNIPEVTDYGDFDVLSRNQFALRMVEDNSIWRAFSIDFVAEGFYVVEFPDPCSLQNMTTDRKVVGTNPVIAYHNEGATSITLKIQDELGNIDYETQNIIVNSNVAPNANFTSESNWCVGKLANFFSDDNTPITYSWDFDEDGIEDSNLQNPSYTFPTPGIYNVRLDVDDGTCHNFTEEEITIFSEPDFQPNAPAVCVGIPVTFQNETQPTDKLDTKSWSWDLDGEDTQTGINATYTFDSPGLKTITLSTNIEGCNTVVSKTFDVKVPPNSNFSASASSSCTGELLSFTNASTGADTYHWDFGDGTTSTNPDASHIYTEPGNYTVTLSATDTDGCTAQHTQEVAISPVPTADFSYDLPCTGGAGIAFFDESTVSGADILAWQWKLDGETFSSQQNPLLSFDETGTYTVSLEVTSSNGCVAQYQEALDVQGAPEPAYSTGVACEGLATTFTDTTPGSNIVSRLWNIDGNSYTGPTAAHVFTTPGTYDVSLTVTADNFCAATLSSQVTIPDGPSVDYTLSSTCAGDDIVLTDISTPGADAIVSRSWQLDSEEVFNGPQAILTGINPGMHNIALQATTEAGCTYTVSRMVDISPSPVADFEPSVTYGVPPYTVTFTNQSSGATAYSWQINGTEVSTSASFTQTITETGDQLVELVAINASGCTDTTALTLLSEEPTIDLQVVDASLTASGGGQIVSLEVRNEGNLPVEIFDVAAKAGDEFSISERFNRLIGRNESTSVSLSSALQLQGADVICLSVTSAYEDVAPDNNEVCITFGGNMLVEPPYPNPVSDEVTVRVILPSAGNVEVQISGIDGHILVHEQLEDLESGLHFLRYDFSGYRKGMYFITIRRGGDTQTLRVIRQ